MNDDLNPDARRLVDLAREARTPGEDDKLRLAKRLAVPLAASAAVGTAVGTAKATGILSSVGLKIAAFVAVGAVGTLIVTRQLQSETTPVAPSRAVVAAPPTQPAPVIAEQEPAPAEVASEAAPVPSQKPATPPVVHGSRPSEDLAQEAALLHQAQAAWRAGQSAQALQLANQHAARFPRSQLANERDVLRVLSLCKLGQVQAAKQVGARLLRTAKGSPWYQSVAGSCAAD